MLVPFVIDTNSLAPDPRWSLPEQRSHHGKLLKLWQQSGLLIHDGEKFEGCSLHKSVLCLPQNLRSLWQELLKKGALISCGYNENGNQWEGQVSMGTINLIPKQAKVALIDDVQAMVDFGIDDNENEKELLDEGRVIRVCRIILADESNAFQSAMRLARGHIERGDTFLNTWETRFSALAEARIKNITIVDRYALSHFVSSSQDRPSGLKRFLKLLNDHASGPRYVTLYSAMLGKKTDLTYWSADEIEYEFREVIGHFTNNKIRRVKLLTSPDQVFKNDGHDRFIRFQDYVWDIGVGLEVFEGAFSEKRTRASFESGDSIASYQEVENVLANNSATKRIEFSF